MLASFLSGDFLLHIPCLLDFSLGSLSYTSHAGFNSILGVSLTHPMLASILSEEFLLHIPCWLQFYLRRFSYTSRAGFFCFRGVSLTHPELASFVWCVSLTLPMLASILSWEFLLQIPCWLQLYPGSFSDTSRAGFICMRGVSLIHPVLGSVFI